MAPKLEEKFNLTQQLTYQTMGEHEGVDTSAYRMAIWNYIQALFGIRHDDYDYAQVEREREREREQREGERERESADQRERERDLPQSR